MDYYLLWKVLLVIILTDIMDLCSFYRQRNKGYFCIKQYGEFKRDAWHDSKWILLLFVFGEFVEWDIVLLFIAALLNWFIHEQILFGGWFKKFINHKGESV